MVFPLSFLRGFDDYWMSLTWKITTERNGVMLNNRKRRPTHPGEILREDILPSAGISQSELAVRIGVSRRIVNEIVHERRAITVDLAHRLSRFFSTTPEFWLNLQQAVDLWDKLESSKAEYELIQPLEKGKAA